MTGIPPGDDLHRRRARDLAEVAAARVLEGRAHEAMLLAWGADLEVLQECVRQALVDRAGQSPAEYYGALERAFAVSDGAVVAEPVPTAAIALAQARAIALERLRPFTGEIHPQWEQVPGLDAVAESTPGSAEQFAAVRLEGHSLTEFARLRQAAAERDMKAALVARVKGETVTAIELAYAADVASTEAYLADSTAAAGDTLLLTLVCRWELILKALGRLPGLPGDFSSAVQLVRDTITGALAAADAERLRARFLAI